MIRVLHIVTYMGRGGLETMLMNYYRNIDRTKVQFDFLVHREVEADYDKEILDMGGKIYHVSRLIPWSKEYKNELKRFLKEHPEYKIVHVHQDCLSSVALKCAEECGIPVRIAHSHSSSAVKNIKYPIKRYYMKDIPKYATHLFACGEQAGKWMFSGLDFNIVKNAIDIDKYKYSEDKDKNLRAKYDLENKFIIGHVGRFRKEKNQEFIIDIFNNVSKKVDNAILMLVGDGEEQQRIEEKVKQLNLQDKVMFMGARSDVNDLMQMMNVFLFPSLYEGLGIVLIEAQASGLPCVVSSTIPEEAILDKKNISIIMLEDSIDIWVNNIAKYSETSRKNNCHLLRKAGYDIKYAAKWLEEFYVSK